uniref:Protein kinase domain-containing protein n=1 Tax=Zooxanthella nutricula TaxID=1333877 RepID=A0A7S2VMK9_9DINO
MALAADELAREGDDSDTMSQTPSFWSTGSQCGQTMSVGGAEKLFRFWDRLRRTARWKNQRRLSEYDTADLFRQIASVFAEAGFVYMFFPPRRISSFVTCERVLGEGSFGSVFLAKITPLGLERLPGLVADRMYAVKQGSLDMLEPIEVSMTKVSSERVLEFQAVMMSQAADDANIARLYIFMMEPSRDRHYEILEYLAGPDLFRYLNGRTETVSEATGARLVSQLLLAVAFLHMKCGLLHRDIKPENLAFAGPLVPGQPLPPLKLFDFGLSWILEKPATGDSLRQFIKLPRAGTPVYMAPENWLERCGPPSDIWAVGVVTYVILCLSLPFGLEKCDTGDSIRAALRTPLRWRDGLEPSADAQDFVTRACTRARPHRATVEELMQHHWFKNSIDASLQAAPGSSARATREATLSVQRSRAEGRASALPSAEGGPMTRTAVPPTPEEVEEELAQ